MIPSLKKNLYRFLLLLLIIAQGIVVKATDLPQQVVLRGSQGQINESDINYLTDQYASLGIIQTYSIKNVVSLEIDPDNIVYIPHDFEITLGLHITALDANGNVIVDITKNFYVNYKKAGGTKYDARQYYAFENAVDVSVQIVSGLPPGSSGDSWIRKVLLLRNELVADRDYEFNCGTKVANPKFGLGADKPENWNIFEGETEEEINWTNQHGEIIANWELPDNYNGPMEFDLEWAWVDRNTLEEYKVPGSDPVRYYPDKIFDNNTTRVTITDPFYKIPLLYDVYNDDDGYLFMRVRVAQVRHNGQRIEGEWSWSLNDINYDHTLTAYHFQSGPSSTWDHNWALNWQATTSYAEEGKRKSVIQYFDGTLRGRQTVTKDNTTNNTVVAETFYDYQGRPLIQVLPAPTLRTIIQYAENFNRTEGHSGYPKELYDVITGTDMCSSPAPSLTGNENDGAANYYSALNPLVSNGDGVFNKYIPAAGDQPNIGYPFAETRYAPDATGRIAAQGGVGPNHQLGSGHETKYFYESVDQKTELDPLFGTDAGDASHYFKNLVKDANGQYSVSYVDMHGRTVATALAGNRPSNLNGLKSYNEDGTIVKKNMLDPETNIIDGKTIRSSKSLVVTKSSVFGDESTAYTFNYSLTPGKLGLPDCNSTNICYDCMYDLVITITSECDNPENAARIHTFQNITLAELTNNCSITNSPGFNIEFKEYLPEGSYIVTKELILNTAAQNYYRENVFIPANTCKTLSDFVEEEYALFNLTGKNCELTCEQCTTAIGGSYEVYRDSLLAKLGELTPDEITALEPQVKKSWEEAVASCKRICGEEGAGEDYITGMHRLMVMDMVPGRGQYARYDGSLTYDPVTGEAVPPNTSDPGDPHYTEQKYNIFKEDDLADVVYTGAVPLISGVPDWKYGLWLDPALTSTPAYTLEMSNPYKDVFGITAPVNALISDPAGIYTKEQFGRDFDLSWAESLLPHHPEYCKLRLLETKLRTSYQFEAAINKKDNWADVQSYFTSVTTLIDADPFFSMPENAGLKTTMTGKIGAYPLPGFPCGSVTLWRLASAIVKCRNKSTAAGCGPGGFVSCMNDPSILNQPTGLENNATCPDIDYIWKIYRTLYMTERTKIISGYLTSNCSSTSLPDYGDLLYNGATKIYNFRFPDLQNPGPTGNADLDAFINQVNTGNVDGDPHGQAILAANSSAACDAYSAMWINRLKECPQMIPHLTEEVQTEIIAKLKAICVGGSDASHPYGASSLPPVHPPVDYESFPDVITDYLSQWDIDISGLCHPYLIDAPPPYDKAPALTNSYIVTKPSACECDRITDMQANYLQTPNYAGTFSNYLLDKYGTKISDADLNTLLSMCAAEDPSCVFLKDPITLPPVLQCNGPVETCISCIELNTLVADFRTSVSSPGLDIPFIDPQSEEQNEWNKAFTRYANFTTGFAKSWVDYAAFRQTCDAYYINTASRPGATQAVSECVALTAIRNNFRQGILYKNTVPHLDSSGCDTTHWKINTGGWGHDPQYGLADFIQDGIMQVPASEPDLDKPDFNYVDTLCIENGFAAETRFRFNYNPAEIGHPFASMYYGITSINLFFNNRPSDSPEGIIVSFGMNNPTNTVYLQENTGGIITVLSPIPELATDLKEWHTYRVEVADNTYRILIDGVLRKIVPFTGTLSIFNNFAVGSYGSGLQLDWFKLYNRNNELRYFEDFLGCDSFAQQNLPRKCYSSCRDEFADYYNTIMGTSLSFTQIDERYVDVCGSHPDVCEPPSLPKLCGLNEPVSPDYPIVLPPPCDGLDSTILTIAEEKYNQYLEDLRNTFDNAYYNKCMSVKDLETFTVQYTNREYHYTLYYYDQAGNLVRTIPPEGVRRNATTAFLDAVKNSRNSNGSAHVPGHKLPTDYRYNTLNQVTEQQTPDAGVSRFWYDLLGRLVLSQNEEQATLTRHENYHFSYTEYDALGRIKEVGQLVRKTNNTVNQDITTDKDLLQEWFDDRQNKEQITRTSYDIRQPDLWDPPSYELLQQNNLRNRVSCTMLFDTYADMVEVLNDEELGIKLYAGGQAATYYTYDIHGNVDVLLQHYNNDIMKASGNEYKRIEYDYDLISGKVNNVRYQPGMTDQFYHRYNYDAENRIINVETSHDNIAWDKDARYLYYRHGPLARSIIGEEKVQGLDYAYTIQGWLKGVNSTTVSTYGREPGMDMGGDGFMTGSAATDINPLATDAFGFNLNYFNNDYKAINADMPPFAAVPELPGSAATGRDLFNGNIASMAVNVPILGKPFLYGYRYDQLNRLVAMDAFNGLQPNSSEWNPVMYADKGYQERITYDANGNILTYKRNGNAARLSMDELNYKYYGDKNQLSYVKENAEDAAASEYDKYRDIKKNQKENNYVYDHIGNLIQDHAEGIKGDNRWITWTVYGKIASITKLDPQTGYEMKISYTYDPSGNRISKTVENFSKDEITYTYYVRDASGNVMSVYDKKGTKEMRQKETHLYGSSRLGIFNVDRVVDPLAPAVSNDKMFTFVRGNKFFELSNHLGNVLVTVSDRKIMVLPANSGCPPGSVRNVLDVHTRGNDLEFVARQEVNIWMGFESWPDDDFVVYINGALDECPPVDPVNPPDGIYFMADVITATDYYPFGMQMPGRQYELPNSEYRYGFNGKEKATEIYGEGNAYDFGARMYDPRIGKWFSVDPMREVYTSLSPYSYSANNPINVLDAEGNVLRDKNGNIIATSTGVVSSNEIPLSATRSKSGVTTTQTASMKYETVKIYADDGTPIEALRLIEAHVVIKKYDSKGNLLSTTKESLSSHGFEAVSDCHGYTFAKGKLWINDDQVNTLLDHDGYTRNTTESKADAVIFKKGGAVVHSAVRNKDGTYSNDAGIMTLEKNVSLDKASRGLTDVKTPSNVEFVDKKGVDKVVDIKSGSVSGGVRYTTEADVNKSLHPTSPSPGSTGTTTPSAPKFDFKIPPIRAAANATYVRPPIIIPLKKP